MKEGLLQTLKDCERELDMYDREYKHITPPELLERLRQHIASIEHDESEREYLMQRTA